MTIGSYRTVKVEKDDGIGWLYMNRPEKRNAMNPQMHFDMDAVLPEIESDAEIEVVILTGAGEAFCAGQDLREYFRGLDGDPAGRKRAGEASERWRNRRLMGFNKPTIAMVNGYCIGGGFTQMLCCDFAIAADEALFGLSEVNWGILPGGLVSKKLTDTILFRHAMYYACTGRTLDGRRAAEIGLVNESYPRARLREETVALARELMEKNAEVLRATKHAIRAVRRMDDDQAFDYLAAKGAEIKQRDRENAYANGIKQFLDDKSYKPTYGAYDREQAIRDNREAGVGQGPEEEAAARGRPLGGEETSKSREAIAASLDNETACGTIQAPAKGSIGQSVAGARPSVPDAQLSSRA